MSETGYERLKIFMPKALPETWHHVRLKTWDELMEQQNITRLGTNPEIIQFFDPKLITAFDHQSYGGRTWIEILGKLKRFNRSYINVTSYQDARNWVFSDKEPIVIHKIRNEYMVGLGNHRCTVARFMGLTLPQVTMLYSTL